MSGFSIDSGAAAVCSRTGHSHHDLRPSSIARTPLPRPGFDRLWQVDTQTASNTNRRHHSEILIVLVIFLILAESHLE